MVMYAAVCDVAYHLPQRALGNEEIARAAGAAGLSPEKIKAKTGIETRRLAAADECASDLAVRAAQNLFAAGACTPAEVDFLLLCTQSPDYLVPTTACLVQDRLGLPTRVGALDVNLGCSGFVYGLSLAKGLVE